MSLAMGVATLRLTAAVPLPEAKGEKPASIGGVVQIDGVPPAAKKHVYDPDMARHTGEKEYTEETWLVGKDNGLANCVVTLRAKDPKQRVKAIPLPPVTLDKVGVRYVPRVLVVTPGTEIVCRNKESPCKGFLFRGHPLKGGNANFLVAPGREQPWKFESPDLLSVSCDIRPYGKGYVHVLDTPYFAVTDPEGRFRIHNLLPGDYLVAVWHEGAAKPRGEAQPLEVRIHANRHHEVKLRIERPAGSAKSN